VETVNYRTVKLPTGMEIPVYVKNRFGDFYRSMFSQAVKRENMSVVFTEYAWDMGWCDPCAADPLSTDELRKLGVFWLDGPPEFRPAVPGQPRPPVMPRPGPRPQDVFITRLHVRYDSAHFPEDLVFQETADRSNFQGRYVLRHPWTGEDSCEAATQYRRDVLQRRDREAQMLASLTGWDINQIRQDMNGGKEPATPPRRGGSIWR
jgi:hypothetical protein